MAKHNHIFAEATTGIAFILTLSKRQCNTLLRLRASEAKSGKPQPPGKTNNCLARVDRTDPAHLHIVQVDNLRPLRDRGLVFWHMHAGQPAGFGGLTKAGELTADLLLEAGMTIETTNTLSVLRRLDRAA